MLVPQIEADTAMHLKTTRSQERFAPPTSGGGLRPPGSAVATLAPQSTRLPSPRVAPQSTCPPSPRVAPVIFMKKKSDFFEKHFFLLIFFLLS